MINQQPHVRVRVRITYYGYIQIRISIKHPRPLEAFGNPTDFISKGASANQGQEGAIVAGVKRIQNGCTNCGFVRGSNTNLAKGSQGAWI